MIELSPWNNFIKYSGLFQDELVEIKRKVTGPVMDNLNCYYTMCSASQEEQLVEMSNINKILLISRGQLIYCGSAFGGRCNASDLSTLEVI